MPRIDDGFPTLISFGGLDSGVTLKIWEREVTPPGVDGGGANDTTNMRNTYWRTRAPKKLVTLTTMSFVAQYDAELYDTDQIQAMVNVNQPITITFPDTSSVVFWGWLDKFNPNAITEGNVATANCVIEPSNQDADGNEIAPVYNAPA